MKILAWVTLILFLSFGAGCVNPYRSTVERTIPVVDHYITILPKAGLSPHKESLYMNQAIMTRAALVESLKTE